jgi:hypothetical protein
MRLLITALFLAISAPAEAQEVAKDRPAPQLNPIQQDSAARAGLPAARQADVASMDAIIAALYDVISGPMGQKRDWNRFRSLFYPGAKLMPSIHPPTGPARILISSPDEFAARSAPILEQRGFFERETARTAEQFGSIAHVFSTYDSRNKLDDPQPFARGINSIQLLNDGQRWWVVSIYWDAERPGLTIPDKYLRK